MSRLKIKIWSQRILGFAHICLLVILSFAPSRYASAEGSSNPDKSKYFQLEGEGAWSEISAEALNAYSAQVLKQRGQAVDYLTGYTTRPGKKQFELPIILVTTNENGKFPEKQLAEITRSLGPTELDERFKKERLEGKLSKMPPLKAGAMSYEEARQIVWMEAVVNPPEQGTVHVITAMKLIETGAINFTLYASPSDKEVRLRAFNNFLNQVRINPKLKYTATGEMAPQKMTKPKAEFMASFLFDVILVCLLLGVATWPAFILNKKMLAQFPNRRHFAWGYFLALGTLLIGFLTFVWGIIDADSRALLIWGSMLLSLGAMMYRRNRWAWLAFVILGLNPGAWLINGIYLKNRWAEMRDG